MILRSPLFVAALCLFTAVAARAADVPGADGLADEITALRALGDAGAVLKAVKTAAESYKATKAEVGRRKLLDELGRVVQDVSAGAARVAACKAMVDLKDPKNAWKVLATSMPALTVEEAKDVDLAVVNAAGAMADPAAIKPLLDLLQKAKDKKLCVAAAYALGFYGDDQANRGMIHSQISQKMPKSSVEAATDLDLAVVETVGFLAVSSSVSPLLDLLENSKDGKLRVAAAKALGNFCNDKANRRNIFKQLFRLGKKDYDLEGKDAAVHARWVLLEPAIVASLNQLAGHDPQPSFEVWASILHYEGGYGDYAK